MSIITKGLGENQQLITEGYGLKIEELIEEILTILEGPAEWSNLWKVKSKTINRWKV